MEDEMNINFMLLKPMTQELISMKDKINKTEKSNVVLKRELVNSIEKIEILKAFINDHCQANPTETITIPFESNSKNEVNKKVM